jgi:hypothetical protein
MPSSQGPPISRPAQSPREADGFLHEFVGREVTVYLLAPLGEATGPIFTGRLRLVRKYEALLDRPDGPVVLMKAGIALKVLSTDMVPKRPAVVAEPARLSRRKIAALSSREMTTMAYGFLIREQLRHRVGGKKTARVPTIPQVRAELQYLLKTWTGYCIVCGQPVPGAIKDDSS